MRGGLTQNLCLHADISIGQEPHADRWAQIGRGNCCLTSDWTVALPAQALMHCTESNRAALQLTNILAGSGQTLLGGSTTSSQDTTGTVA